MLSRFFRAFFWAVLVASLVAWLYVGTVGAGSHEAVLVEDHLKGIDSAVIFPGQTRFIPARAYPNRVTLHRVDIGPRVKDYAFQLPLAQAETLDLDESFHIKMNFRLEYEIDPDALYDLFSRLDKKDWARLDPYLELRLHAFFTRALRAKLYRNEGDLVGLDERLSAYLTGDALKEINQAFIGEGLRFRGILGAKTYVPDLALYRAVIERSREILAQKVDRSKKRDQARASREEELIRDQAYFSRLENIGKLLREYPNLRDYLAIDRLGKNVEVMVFPYERWFSPESDQIAKALEKSRKANNNKNGAGVNPNGNAPGADQGAGRGANRARDLTPP